VIRITRPSSVPATLKGKGKDEIDDLKARYNNEEREFEFKSSIYGADDVKEALIEMQHGKCVFCEAKVTHIAHGDVEHFRPKGGYTQSATEPVTKPGYYWLAYEWKNLTFSCQICNQRHKKNLFPLADPSKRCSNHKKQLSREKPMLIDPTSEDPEPLIGFRQEYPFPIDDDPRAEATIKALGLGRERLAEVRRDHLALVRELITLRDALKAMEAEGSSTTELVAHRKHIDKTLKEHSADRAQYASMVRWAIKSS
jgi:uncharacterized protein (TIGR02646 family)